MKTLIAFLLMVGTAHAQTINPPSQNPMVTGTPSIFVASGAGTGSSATISGNNASGIISVATGTATTSGSILATIIFGGSIISAPNGCTLFPQNTNAVGQAAMIYTSQPTTTGWSIGVGGSPIPVSINSFQWSYTCI